MVRPLRRARREVQAQQSFMRNAADLTRHGSANHCYKTALLLGSEAIKQPVPAGAAQISLAAAAVRPPRRMR
jgi:hypothetical protein